MSDEGPWQPPQAGEMATPPVVSTPLEPSPPQSRRPRGVVLAAGVGATALAAAAAFGISRLGGASNAGGAASPEEAGRALLAAFENEDVLGAVDLLLPGERETLRQPLTDLTTELSRVEVLSPDANLSSISGVDVVLENEAVEVRETNVDDIVNLRLTATGTATVDGEELPIGDLVLDNVEGDVSELDVSNAEASEEFTIPLTAVERDGRWYVSAFYTIAEQARRAGGDDVEAVDVPEDGITPVGGKSPEAAVDAFLGAVESLDLEAMIAALNPDEFEALQRYAPTFLPDAQSELDQSVAENQVSVSIADPEYTVSGSGDTRWLAIDYFRVDVSAEGEEFVFEYEEGCATVISDGETVNLCELARDPSMLDEMFDDPEPARALMAAFEEAFADYENPGFIVKQVDGQWFLSPIASGSEQLLAVLRALDRDEIERLLDASTAFEEATGDEVVVDLGLDELDD